MITYTTKSSGGTSFLGTVIRTTPQKLVDLFPVSYYESNDGKDKVNFDFTLEVDGEVVTIYDWKEYRKLKMDEEINFHIGGLRYETTEKAKKEILELIKNQGKDAE
jgi:hypothetical protein